VSLAEVLRARLREAPVESPAQPWRKVAAIRVDGLDTVRSADGLLLVPTTKGVLVIDCATGARAINAPGAAGEDLTSATPDGWTVDVVAADWPAERVVLSGPGRLPFGVPDRGGWQVVHDEQFCELRTTGFTPDGRTLVIASSCELRVFSR
jgi:hypothetical protein